MLGRPVLQRTFVLVLIAVAPCAAFQAVAQPAATSVSAHPAPPAADDMTMPDDLGAPMSGSAAPAEPAPTPDAPGPAQRLSVNTPIDVIASTPQGKAVLEHDLPGLCERPEYVMFRTMTPAKLALLSNGRISRSKLTRLQEHLVRVSVVTTAEPPRHNLLAKGGTQVRRFSHAIYRKVLSALEWL